jgi:iron(III) transport system substrate-binding protein
MDPVFADFMKAYPKIKVTVSQVPTADLLPRLDQELAVGAQGADLTFHASPGWFVDNFTKGNFKTLELSPDAQKVGAAESVGKNNFAGV